MENTFRILHTSDWHLARPLFNKKRDAEYEAMLESILNTLRNSHYDLLIVAGDVFDTSQPSNQALSLYHRFLASAYTLVPHIVVIAGNHDSPSLLASSKPVLDCLNIRIVTSAKTDDEIIELKDENGKLEAVVAAVPYLRDADIRKIEADEEIEESDEMSAKAVEKHFESVDERLSAYVDKGIPLIGTAHLFASGSSVARDEGEHRIKVGTLSQIEGTKLFKSAGYTALGHIHMMQSVASSSSIFYSGSPLAQNFGERNDRKGLLSIEFEGANLKSVSVVEVPVTIPLVTVKGTLNEIKTKLNELENIPSYLCVVYQGVEYRESLSEEVQSILREKDQVMLLSLLAPEVFRTSSITEMEVDLASLEPADVFQKLLDDSGLEEDEREKLTKAFSKILNEPDAGVTE